jgi:signal recognition particle GTPase
MKGTGVSEYTLPTGTLKADLEQAEELLKLFYRSNVALRAAGRVSEELRHEQHKDMEKLRYHIQELVKHIGILIKQNEELQGYKRAHHALREKINAQM